ncbi:MAG TPA: SDR family oxidoreductase [Chloroflexota bacterium]|nr:SDR family oxidoreductase [Chloroflexota bacterium]
MSAPARVLVTGHLGYLGPPVVAALHRAGHEVAGLDSGLFEDCALEPDPPVPTIRRDIRDVTPADLRGVHAVVHLAGLSNDPLGLLAPDLTHEINAAATLRLATAAREAGVRRFLFSSSCSVYGTTAEAWVDEATPPRPVTPYAAAKAAAERGLAGLAGPAFCVLSLRNATAFGYSPRLRTDLVVNDLVAGAVLRNEIRLLSDGSAWRPLVHVSDLARAFALALDAPAEHVNGAVLNVGADAQNYTVRTIARTVAEALPEARLSIPGDAGRDVRSYRVRFDRLHRLLPEFACRVDLRAGIADLVAQYRRVGLRSTDGCVRLEHLKRRLAAGEVAADLRPRLPAPAAAAAAGA